MIFLPPQHGKSELVSRRFPAFVLGRNPELRLIGSSHTNDLATSMNRNVQRIMCDNAYRNLFPDCRLNDRGVRTGSRVEARRTLNHVILDHIVLDHAKELHRTEARNGKALANRTITELPGKFPGSLTKPEARTKIVFIELP